METSLIKALLSLREKPNFDIIVSTSNDSSQTLAHLSVLFGYIPLLNHLVDWRIDLTIADISGLTALHYAYLKEDRESIQILLSAGASPSIEDKLGRVPRDLAPVGSDLVEGDFEAGGGSPRVEHSMDWEIALGEQFTALEAQEEHDDDSGHGGSASDSDASINDDEDEQEMDPGSPTLPAGPSSSIDVMNLLLMPKKYHGLLRREREVFNCRLCPEDNKLDFMDPEEALHHMTKDHDDMGYGCSCGW